MNYNLESEISWQLLVLLIREVFVNAIVTSGVAITTRVRLVNIIVTTVWDLTRRPPVYTSTFLPEQVILRLECRLRQSTSSIPSINSVLIIVFNQALDARRFTPRTFPV
jgi:hypothetical protein